MASTAIWWIRRDLRLTDNQALQHALSFAEAIIPVFILDPALINSTYNAPADGCSKRLAFLLGGLRQLSASLRTRSSHLVIRQGQPEQVLRHLLHTTGAEKIFAEADYSPYAQQRDKTVARCLPLHLVDALTLHPPVSMLKTDDTPYTVYTPFSKSWKALPLPPQQAILSAPKIIATPTNIKSLPVPNTPTLPASVPFPPGEAEAQHRLQAFLTPQKSGTGAPVHTYDATRNRTDLAGTSQLSPYLRFGMLSARQAIVAAYQAIDSATTPQQIKSAATWLNELIWREFYVAILYHFPHVRLRNFRSQYDDIVWDNDAEAFAAWCSGHTGYPIVDAAMRQLTTSGWMHNRTRMIVASFLVKDLLIDWRWGERFFMQHLVDGDPAANNGGWQWVAGTGTDAAPYFRIFNPILQSQKFDPDGDYIRHWLPELANVPTKYIHTPWSMPSQMQQQIYCQIGADYPTPIIDHKWARQRTLAAYKQAKSLHT